MATVSSIPPVIDNGYPTTDRRIMPGTEWHRRLREILIEILLTFYQAQPLVCVSGDLLLFYQRGNKRRHVSPDLFVVKGVPKRERDNYLLWQEGKGPEVVIEI